ncbi:GntR family transcriptional regulator [Jiella mangrovi]|uniref:GntR family transcriptional regulator n=1 Tax=Jiella mangrovi TaxID=2821407 RepID=A0ABS4BN68_9HYPH|nr:GntR family transcriptional regulator [Jiella mangrovi]MBP0618174.1 GntR family transcriptional regulator [Jiella mangrovi]
MTSKRLLYDSSVAARQPTLVGAAYSAIKDAIRDGFFPPGFQGSELEIAQRLGMSRTPVHQAIIQLQAEGMVELRAKRGVVIVALSPDDMREVYDVIIAVEGMAAQLIAVMPPSTRERVCASLDLLNRQLGAALAKDDLLAWADHDGRFHAALVAGAGNGRLERIATINIDQSYRARRVTLGLRPKPFHSLGEHQAIIDALRAGDARRASDAAQAHKVKARDLIIELLVRHNMRHL